VMDTILEILVAACGDNMALELLKDAVYVQRSCLLRFTKSRVTS
jgi:hypothetical protein